MHTKIIIVIFLVTYLCRSLSVPIRILFEKCDTKGFSCPVSPIFGPRIDIVFECNNVTTQDVIFYIWQLNAPANIASFTIQKCENVQISFTCFGENKPIQWLKIQDIGELKIIPTTVIAHNPPEIYFQNISYMESIPTNTFSQIKYERNKIGCFIPINDTNTISFNDLNIGTIQTDAFRNLQLMKKFSWSNVSVNRIETRAVNITFEEGGGCGELKSCNLGVIEPMGFLTQGERFSITRGQIGEMWTSCFNGSIYDFQFSNNTVYKIQSGAISILSQNAYVIGNTFRNVESGAFSKISPGLLHDGRRFFNNLRFLYFFNNNVIGQVEDGSFRPDIASYKNVHAYVGYLNNTLPCSCEGLLWLNDDVHFGARYTAIKEFNTMLLDPQNSNICVFSPCTCLGGNVQDKKLAGTVKSSLLLANK